MNRSSHSFRLLIVDDDPSMLSLLKEFLEQYYTVDAVSSGHEALECLSQRSYDLVISDINMPHMMGYELLRQIRLQFPDTKTALITAWSVSDIIQNVLEYDIGNIISKTVPFDFEELQTTVQKLLSGDIFGLYRYLEEGANIHDRKIRCSEELPQVRGEVLDYISEEHFDDQQRMVLRLMLDESISNAVFHPHGLPKGSAFEFPEEHSVVIQYGKDEEKIGVSVSDQMGKLTQQMILNRLADCTYPTEESLMRDGGRGLYLMHCMVDRLIINIHRGVRTEVILLVYRSSKEKGQRPILIHEI